jgi:uncharacterized protein
VILYLDTSALVKIYVEETRSTDVRENAKRAEGLATSRIAYAEAQAAFARKRRRRVCRALITVLWSPILTRIGTIISFLISLKLWFGPRVLAENHALRGADAIHPASAVTLSKRVSESIMFLCFDSRLATAARKEDLRL